MKKRLISFSDSDRQSIGVDIGYVEYDKNNDEVVIHKHNSKETARLKFSEWSKKINKRAEEITNINGEKKLHVTSSDLVCALVLVDVAKEKFNG